MGSGNSAEDEDGEAAVRAVPLQVFEKPGVGRCSVRVYVQERGSFALSDSDGSRSRSVSVSTVVPAEDAAHSAYRYLVELLLSPRSYKLTFGDQWGLSDWLVEQNSTSSLGSSISSSMSSSGGQTIGSPVIEIKKCFANPVSVTETRLMKPSARYGAGMEFANTR